MFGFGFVFVFGFGFVDGNICLNLKNCDEHNNLVSEKYGVFGKDEDKKKFKSYCNS